ncbi:hypothetical protein [Xanthomonas campestris]|uniref:hypothetical protein n=1 Tax=Xanthomonas campestris TaxID=339 RepID=UPI001EE86A42|nr:hypothetical protein [Xanthomonas campestris]
MIAPTVNGYGDSGAESFDDYYARWPKQLSNFPQCVVESWVHRHWQDFERDWLNRSIDQFVFAQANLTNAEIMHIGHFDEWLETLDYWGDELFRDQIRRSTWLATYMLTNGTSPVPIIVAANSSGLMHPKGATMRSNQLIEGHMRLAYLRGMIRQNHTSLRQSHLVWLL